MDAKKNFIVDLVALVVYLAAASPALTGIAVHEWLGIGVLAVLVVHCAVHADWVASVAKGARASSWGARANLVLDALILVAFMVVVVSGVCISGSMLPMMGLYSEGYFFWDPLHAIAAKALLALLLVHVVVHWKWLVGLMKKGKDGHDE